MKKPQLSTRDVVAGLKAAGFEEQPKTSTSHVKWIKRANGEKLVVTVDAHLEPFSHTLIASMAKQAGMTVKQFYEICSKDGQKRAKKGVLTWLGFTSDNS